MHFDSLYCTYIHSYKLGGEELVNSAIHMVRLSPLNLLIKLSIIPQYFRVSANLVSLGTVEFLVLHTHISTRYKFLENLNKK